MNNKSEAKIGFAAPLTGDQAIAGIPMRQCAELAVNQANERNDLPFYLSLQAEDDQADPRTAEVIARRFVADPAVIGVIGHKNSGPSAAAGTIYNSVGLVQITPSSTNPQLSRQGYKTFFRLCAHDALQGKVAAQYATHVLQAKRIAIVHDQTGYGQPLAEVVRESVHHQNAEVVLFEGVAVGQKDFNETVFQIKQADPDLIYLALTEIEGSILARQLRTAEVETVLFGVQGGRESKFLQLAGAAAKGSYHTYAGANVESRPGAQAFLQEFTARYGPVPGYGAEVYDAANLLISALKRATRLDRRAVLGEVANMRAFNGVTGQIVFDVNGDRQNAEVTIWREEGAQMRLQGTANRLIPKGML